MATLAAWTPRQRDFRLGKVKDKRGADRTVCAPMVAFPVTFYFPPFRRVGKLWLPWHCFAQVADADRVPSST